jgi:arginase
MKTKQIAIVGARLDLGAGRRGVDMGPSAVRVANLGSRLEGLGYTVRDLGNIDTDQMESVPVGPSDAKYLPQIADACTRLAREVEKSAAMGEFPLVLGGDHSISAGTMAGISRRLRKKGKTVGLLWIDAHPDINTPDTSLSGNVHGMPLACCIGMGPKELSGIFDYSPKVYPRNVALVGIRDVDLKEREHINASGITAFTMRDIDEKGMRIVMDEAIRTVSAGTEGFHLSFDMDAVDPLVAPGVGTPVPGGLTYREAHLAMEIVCDSGRMVSLEVVEVNPVIDERNRTADLAVELILSALGKRIL